MANKSFLSAAEKRDLMEHLAAKGENYDRFIEWCEKHGVPPERRYTKDTLHKWYGRRRDQIRALREQHRVQVRKDSTFDKTVRLQKLEDAATRLERRLEEFDITEGTWADYARLEEQLRKTLESIAKERGEFNRADEDDGHMISLQSELARQAIAAMNRGSLPEPVIEGEWAERGEGESRGIADG